MGIRGKLIICFVAFALLMLAITWVFQIGLLGRFYERTKNSELEYATQSMAEAVSLGNHKETAAMLAGEYGICIRVFRVAGYALGEEEGSVQAAPPCVLHHMPREKLTEYYQNALENGGEWENVFSMERGEEFDEGGEGEMQRAPDKAPDGKPPQERKGDLLLRIARPSVSRRQDDYFPPLRQRNVLENEQGKPKSYNRQRNRASQDDPPGLRHHGR